MNLLDYNGVKYGMWYEQDPASNSRVPRTVRLTDSQAKKYLKPTDETLGDGYGN